MGKIMVAMSGGVDSSVAAAVLKEQEEIISGATLRLVEDNGVIGAEVKAARDVCEKLGNGKLVMARDLKSNNQVIGNGDDIHFCRDALVTLGERYFDAYCEIKGSNK